MRLNIINHGWYWEGLDKDIAQFIQDCSLCAQINSSKHLKPPIKQIISTNHERYIIDLWELPPEITDIFPYKYIIDIIDHFSKYLASYPLITKSSKEVLAHIQNFIQLNGKPAIVQTDNGGEFVNSIQKHIINN